jgi:AcrR family transcriptional regulator
MLEKKCDPRIGRTKQQLRESLKSILKEKPFREITTRDVTEHANVNRSTFYAHYIDIFDLLRDCISEGITVYDEAPAFLETSEQIEAYVTRLTKAMNFYVENPQLCLTVLKDFEQSHYMSDFIKINIQRHYETMQSLQPDQSAYFIPGKYITNYSFAGLVRVLILWIEGGFKEPPDVMAKYFASTMILTICSLTGRMPPDLHLLMPSMRSFEL